MAALLARHGVRPRRSLGQHFLVHRPTLERIIAAAELRPADAVIEVGPGAGALTAELARRAGHVVAIELDRALLGLLAEVTAGLENVEVRHGDAARQDWASLVSELAGASGRPVKMVANLPYQVTTPVLTGLLESGAPWERAVVMVQREFAERLTIPPGRRASGAITVLAHYWSVPERVARVPAAAFFPPPRVESCIVRLRRRPRPAIPVRYEDMAPVVRAAFAQRRKTLLNALAAGLHRERADVDRRLRAAGIDPGRRAETLTLAEWGRLVEAVRQAPGPPGV